MKTNIFIVFLILLCTSGYTQSLYKALDRRYDNTLPCDTSQLDKKIKSDAVKRFLKITNTPEHPNFEIQKHNDGYFLLDDSENGISFCYSLTCDWLETLIFVSDESILQKTNKLVIAKGYKMNQLQPITLQLTNNAGTWYEISVVKVDPTTHREAPFTLFANNTFEYVKVVELLY